VLRANVLPPLLDSVIPLREKLLVLSLANTLQPISEQVLVAELPKRLQGARFAEIFDELEEGGLLRRLSDGKLVVGFRGRAVFGAGRLGKERDIARILRLFDRSKEGERQ